MSMRDFITRVLNASVVAQTTPRIAVETTPPIVEEETTDFDPPPSCEDISENGVPFYWDIESRSAASLSGGKYSVGVRAYGEDPTTEVLCVSYARGNGPVETWVPGQAIPEAVLAAAADPICLWVAHNAAFERAILECILIPRHGWPMVPVDRHVCTLALALAHAYPGSLEGVAEVLGLVNRKDVAREKIVRKMWKPRKPLRGEDNTKTYWVDSPELRTHLTSTISTTSPSSASCINIHGCGRCRHQSRTRGCWTQKSMIAEYVSTLRWPRRRPGSRRGLSLI